MAIELEVQQADVVINTPIEVEVDNRLATVTDVTNDLQVEINRKEYSIVGDEVYIPSRYEDAPTWLQDIINQVVAVSIAAEKGDLNQTVESLNQLITELEVAKNTYTQSIISSNDIDERINTAITTLNSSLADADATILNIAQTRVTPEEASALVIDGINAQLDTETGSIGAVIGALQQAVVNGDSANATSIDSLASTITGEVDARATAVNTLNTYVGITNTGTVTGTGILADVNILQKQNDGVIETYTGVYDVMVGIEDPNTDTTNDELDVTQEPYATWIATDTTNGNEEQRAMHVGDVYIKYSAAEGGYKNYEKAYKFIKTALDTTSPYATDTEGYTWALIVDTDAQNAYVAALNAYDLADDKRRVFVSKPNPPYDVGDLWLVAVGDDLTGITAEVGDILRCTETKGSTATYEANDWVRADNYRESMAAIQDDLNTWRTNEYATFVTSIQNQVDKKAESYYTESDPSLTWEGLDSEHVGDLWKKPSDNTEYVYQLDGGVYKWVQTDVPDVVYDTIDGKKAIYVGDDVPAPVSPVTLEVNDMWITGDNPVGGRDANSIYVWNGVSWEIPVKYTDDTAVTTLETGLGDGTVTIRLDNAYVGTTLLEDYVANEIDDQVVVYSGTDHTIQTGMKLNDIYIEKAVDTSGAVPVDVVNTYKYNGTSWDMIGGNTNLTALADLADGKRTVYAGSTVPTGAVDRDLWIPEANVSTYVKGEVYQYLNGAWTLATKYTEDLGNFVDEINPKVATLQNQVDGKIEYLFYDNPTNNPLTGISTGWGYAENGNVVYYYDTDEGYWYSSSLDQWLAITDTSIYSALKTANDARAVADSKITSYYIDTFANVQALSTSWSTQEKSDNVGDIATVWNDGTLDNNGTWRWNGTSWVNTRDKKLISLASDVTDLSTELSNGTSTWAAADSTLENSLTTKIDNDVATVESKFEYNSNLTINGITQSSGFGLVNSASSVPNPPVSGSEFWIEADRLRFTDATTKNQPFYISNGDTVFNGKVTFNSGGTPTVGTIDDAITANVEQVAVGDKNINITDNLIPTTSLISDLNNAGYQFVGDPIKTSTAGIEVYTEPQIALDTDDEVYSPFVDEVQYSYYYRFGFKTPLATPTDLSDFKVVTIQDPEGVNEDPEDTADDTVTYTSPTLTLDVGITLAADTWYIVDGLINPAGGDSAGLNGSIRTATGTKVGTVTNYAVPVNTIKVLLGWQTDIVVSRMKLAKITADTITSNTATVDYVDTTVGGISWDSLQNKDTFAQQLGYANYSELEAAATSGQTVIDGGYINTDLINAGGINANQINTTGLVADNISAVEIAGLTITGGAINGGVITGARIDGSVIKASYLDLDGELEILTNYHIPVATYNADDTLWTDAIYIEADNEYRLPSITNIISSLNLSVTPTYDYYGNQTNGSDTLKTAEIYPYNAGNVGSNRKSVTAIPNTMSLSSNGNSSMYIAQFGDGARRTNTPTTTITLKFGDTTIFTFGVNTEWYYYKANYTITGAVGSQSGSMNNNTHTWSTTKYFGGIAFTFYIQKYSPITDATAYKASVSMAMGEMICTTEILGTDSFQISSSQGVSLGLPRIELRNLV